MELTTKDELLQKLRDFTENPDNDVTRFKQKIKENLLGSPELLYALDNPDYEGELFNEDGTINYEGDWSLYFDDNIRPYSYFPEVQTESKNYLCYVVEFSDYPRYNNMEKIINVTFTTFCEGKTITDKTTGIPRHNLISAIIRERFNWSNIFGTQCRLISNKESVTDTDYIVETLVFEATLPNSIVKTGGAGTRIINKTPVRTK